MCVYLKGNGVTQQKPQSFTDSPGRDTEKDGIRDLTLTGKLMMGEDEEGGGRKTEQAKEHELQYTCRKTDYYIFTKILFVFCHQHMGSVRHCVARSNHCWHRSIAV